MGTGAEHVLRALDDAGIEYIFGVPGGGTMAIYSAAHRYPDIKPRLVRHEFQAAVMADAYARASGRVAAVVGQGAYVGAYAAGGLIEALTSSSPIVVVGDTSDNGASPMPAPQTVTGEYGSPDLVGLLRSITKGVSLATSAKEAAIGIQMTIKAAITDTRGPAALVVRSRAIVDDVDEDSPPFAHAGDAYLVQPRHAADPRAVEAAVAALARAARPVLFAGKGVHNAFAHDLVAQLATTWSMPVVTSYKGKSAIAETHPLAVGMTGTYGRPLANTVLRESDVVLVVGAKLTSADTAGFSLLRHGPAVIQVDNDPRHAGWSVSPDIALIGDARVVLGQLLSASGGGRTGDRDVAVELERRRGEDPVLNDPELTADSAPVKPQRLVRLLEEHLLPDSNVVVDAGFNRVWMSMFYRPPRPHSFFAPGGMSGMGWSLPASLGVKLARPDEPVVSVTGDGGFMMSVHTLATSAEHDLPVVCVVMNDSSLGMVRHHQDVPVASEFGTTDHAAIARGFGAEGYRVTDSRDLPEAIEQAQACGRTTVIDVVTDREATPDVYRTGFRTATET